MTTDLNVTLSPTFRHAVERHDVSETKLDEIKRFVWAHRLDGEIRTKGRTANTMRLPWCDGLSILYFLKRGTGGVELHDIVDDEDRPPPHDGKKISHVGTVRDVAIAIAPAIHALIKLIEKLVSIQDPRVNMTRPLDEDVWLSFASDGFDFKAARAEANCDRTIGRVGLGYEGINRILEDANWTKYSTRASKKSREKMPGQFADWFGKLDSIVERNSGKVCFSSYDKLQKNELANCSEANDSSPRKWMDHGVKISEPGALFKLLNANYHSLAMSAHMRISESESWRGVRYASKMRDKLSAQCVPVYLLSVLELLTIFVFNRGVDLMRLTYRANQRKWIGSWSAEHPAFAIRF